MEAEYLVPAELGDSLECTCGSIRPAIVRITACLPRTRISGQIRSAKKTANAGCDHLERLISFRKPGIDFVANGVPKAGMDRIIYSSAGQQERPACGVPERVRLCVLVKEGKPQSKLLRGHNRFGDAEYLPRFVYDPDIVASVS